MFRLFSRARATALSAMIGAFLPVAASAADMPYPVPLPTPVNEGPVEWGTGWYLRGQVGGADLNLSTINGMVLNKGFPSNWTLGLGGGYQYNNWFRTDITIDYQELWSRNGQQNIFMPCVVGVAPSLCAPVVSNKAESFSILANAYVDLGTWYGITPYVGVGVGANVLNHRTNLTWTPLGDPYNYTLVTNSDQAHFAYAGMAGLTYDVDPHWKIDLGYRWINFGKIEGVDLHNRRISRDLYSNQVRIGFRYIID